MKKTLSILLCAMLLIAPALNEAQSKKGKSKKSVSALKNDLSHVRSQKKKLRDELNRIRKSVKIVRGDIAGVDNRLEQLSNSLEQTTSNLSKSRSQQQALSGELKQVAEKYDQRKKLAEERMARIYMRGEENFASVLVGSKTLGELAERKTILKLIVERDRELFAEVRQLKQAVADRKRRVDSLVVQIDGLVRSQKAHQFALKDTRNQKHEFLAQLKDKQSDVAQALRELESAENSIEATIASYNAGPGRNTKLVRPGRLMMPIRGGRLGSAYGMRYHPILHIMRMHKGADIGARSGTPIMAAADGIVISASYNRGYGNVIMVDHGGGLSTVYAHCSSIIARRGASVKRGQTIARVGSTGLSTGPHLHFEVRVNGKAVNPAGYV